MTASEKEPPRALRRTRSLCPECLRRIDARYVSDGDAVYLEKSCPEHGSFRTPAWVEKEGAPRFEDWRNDAAPDYPQLPGAAYEKGCPFDCGLCPEHARQTCCALVEVTRRCNMNCPVCYASAGFGADPGLQEIENMLATLRKHGGQANVQLSGGEPTVRDDLPEIIRLTHDKGFPFVQLNTNGLRLAREPGYARKLKDAGLDLVYLQWDGLREETFRFLRGAPFLADKEGAARNAIAAGLSVLFVATIVPGVNDDELGDLLHKALSFGPQVRGLHLQPVASFGRYPWQGRAPRLTLPELMHGLEKQSRGLVRARDFRPPGSEHALCSFSALYQRNADGGLKLIAGNQGCCCPAPRPAAHQARDFVARHWALHAPEPESQRKADAFDDFLAASSLRQRFTLSAMAFQDAHSLDLERLRRCHIHIVTRDKRLVPFCAYNMTSASGVPLYRAFQR